MGWDIDPPKSEAVKKVIEARGAVDVAIVRQALREAAQVGAPGWIDTLAEFVDVHQELGEGRTALHEAAVAGHPQAAERLVELGGDPSQPDGHGHTAAGLAAPPLGARLQELVGFGRACRAIADGDVVALEGRLARDPTLVHQRVLGETLAHVVVLWPAHRPNAAAAIAVLAAAGADLSAPGDGSGYGNRETPLHSAVSANDVAAAAALLDGGADIDAPGAVIANGPPLVDAVVFRQWTAAHLLVARGCRVNLPYAAALGRLDLVRRFVADDGTVVPGACDLPGWPPGTGYDVALNLALHLAVHGAQLGVARWLRERGAESDWIGPTGRSTRDLIEDLARGWSTL